MSLRRWLHLSGRELTDALWSSARSLWKQRAGAALALLLLAALVGMLFPYDRAWLSAVRTASCEHHVLLRDTAEHLSWLGNFWGFNVPLTLGLFLLSWKKNSVRLRRLAVISLAGAALTGSVALVGRGLSGRPRPTAQRADGFYGPHMSSQMQAFPSGHAASAFGCALPLLFNAPVIGVPVTLVATGIAWSRLYLGRHHPTDVLISLLLAVAVSASLSRWVRHSPTTDTAM